MYEKEINELNKKIERCKRSIINGDKNITGKYIMIASVITVGTLLSVAFGGAIEHPILAGIMGLSLTSIAGVKMYDNLVVPSKQLIGQRQQDLREYEELKKKYQAERTKSLSKEVVQDKKNNYSYKRDNTNLTDKDMDDMIDMFKDYDNDEHKKRK